MPMIFPDFKSLRSAANIHSFRQPLIRETEETFREKLADHVEPIDFVESLEIRHKSWPEPFQESNTE